MIQRCAGFFSINERAEQADRNTDVSCGQARHRSSRNRPGVRFRIGDSASRPALLSYGPTSAKSGVLTRELTRGRCRRENGVGTIVSARRCDRGSYLTAGRPILAIAVLDRSWRGRYPSQRPPSRRKRTSPPRKLGGGCRRGGRVAEGGGLLNRKWLYLCVSSCAE